tara:strand:- start:195 stop:512 length:318 start_codon:yes stop_codon:yes gene_type:complete
MGASRVSRNVGRDSGLHSPFSIANLKHRLKVIYGAAAAGRQTEMPCQSIGGNIPFLPASRILVSCSVTCFQGRFPFSISIARGKPATGIYYRTFRRYATSVEHLV